jgi:hypothetical protein
MVRHRCIAFLVSGVLAALPGFAQTTTGTLIGTVKDETGQLLPGATVNLKGAAIVGVQTSTSNGRGEYRFAALPPGDYDLSVELAGFSKLNRQGLHVSVGTTREENVTLKLSERSEEVTVTGEAPVIDTQSNQVGTNYDKDWVRNAPISRFSFFDLINAAPGVNQSTAAGDNRHGSTSLGSSTTENVYMLDGTDFTAPYTGQAWPYPNTDAIEEIEVLTLGAPAEYGNLQGAVFNVVTRQGSNDFHGDANFYFQSQGLTSRNTTDAQDGGQPYHRDRFDDFTAQLSGPIVKDKLWFFGSFQSQHDYDSQPGTDPAFPTRNKNTRVDGKINWQISPKHKLAISYHDDWYHLPFTATAKDAPSSIAEDHGSNPSPNVTYTAVLSDKTYIEARYSGFYGNDHGDPLEPGQPRSATRYVNRDTGEVTGGIYVWYDGNVDKTGLSVKVSHFADKFLGGSHDFKFGVQYGSGGSDYENGYNTTIYSYSSNGYQYMYGYQQIPFHLGGRMKTVGVYADDSFRVNPRLTLNLGVRYDHSKASFEALDILDANAQPTGQKSAAVDNLFTWNSISPRVGFTLKLTSDGKTVLKGHYGRYYRGIITSEFEQAGPSISPRYLFTSLDAAGNPANPTLVNPSLRIDPSMKNPYTDQFVAAFERELFQDLALSLNYTHKSGHDYGGWQDTGGVYAQAPYVDDQGQGATGRTIDVFQLKNDLSARAFLLTNPPSMFTKYDGGIMQLTKRMSHHWQAVASLVVSKSTGQLGSSTQGPTAQQFSTASQFNADPFGRNPNDFINTSGRLIEDRPVTFKTQFVYEIPHGFLVGLNFLHQAGRPWARLARVTDVVGYPTQILAEPIDGSRRVSDSNILDVRLQKEFRIGKQAGVAVFADVLNLLNDDAHEGVLDRLGTSENFGVPSNFILPRRLLLGAKARF